MDEVGMTEDEELLIDSLFYKCDSHNEGLVGVSAVIQYLKSCQNQCNDEPDLLSLAQELETVGMNGKISLAAYRSVLKRWIHDVKGRRDRTSFLDPDGALQQQIDMDNISNNNAELSSYIDTSAVGESQGSACDCEVGELLHELGDLRYHNRRLQEENTKFQRQMDSQDELLALRLKEDEVLRKRLKSVQESLDLRQSVMEENEELKSRLLALQEEIGRRDSRILGLEKDISILENQASTFEAKWQKVTADLEAAEVELQLKENTCLQQQHKLLDEQELKSSHADLLDEKLQQLNALQQKCHQLIEQNEKLQNEKEDVQGTLAELNGKFMRLQSQTEQFDIYSGSLLDEPEVVDTGRRHLPRIPFSTPLHRHSICMELKDKLGQDTHLPSPLCEKLEVTRNPQEVTHNPVEVPLRSVLLPPYMSAWNVDSSGSSLNDYSLELNRRSLSPEPKDLYLESGLNYLKGMENDALQKEVIKLYRLNVDLAEKCHKAELKEAELLEQLKDVQSRYEEEDKRKQEYFQESGEEQTGGLLQGQLRDLWRLVHHPDEEHSSQKSDTSLTVSTDALKHQIFHEISALREKLITRDAALQSLSHQFWRTPRKGRSSSSTLVDALNIDHVRITRNHPFTTRPDVHGDCTERSHQRHKSVPLCRQSDQHSAILAYDSSKVHYPVSSGCSESHQYEWCYEDIDEGDIVTEDMYCKRFDIPSRFKSDGNGDKIDNSCKLFEVAGGRTDVISADIKEPEQLRKSEINPLDSPQTVRRQSYSNAALNKDHIETDQAEEQSSQFSKNDKSLTPVDSTADASSADTTKTIDFCSLSHRGHSGSFKAAIEQGPATSFGLNNTCSVLGHSHMTPDLESNYSLSISSAPKYSSTPLPSFLKSYRCVEKTMNVLKQENVECSIDTNVLATDLFKVGSISLSRLSQGTSNNLSVLREEDGASNRPMPSPDTSNADCSVEVWSITHSDLESGGSGGSTRDSGHSSTIESFDRDNLIDFADGSADEMQGDFKSSGQAVENVPEVCVVQQSALAPHKQPSPIYVGASVADKEANDCTDSDRHSSTGMVHRDQDTWSQDQQHKVPEKNKKDQHSAVSLNNGNVGSSKSPQPLVCSEDGDQGQGMQDPVSFRSASVLSKIRESHLAKRREITRQTQMPQLSELAEKDGSEKTDEIMETRPVILLKDDAVKPGEPSTETIIMPSIPDEFLLRLGLAPDSSEELSDQEVESKFTSLSLAFKTDAQTLEKRLEIQERSRDIAEQNVDKELQGLRTGLTTLNQVCTDPQIREVLARIQTHIDVLEKSTARVSSRAEVYGAIQQEKRMSRAVDIMIRHVENIRRVHEREHAELEEARKLLQDSRSLAPSTIDLPGGGDMLSRRSASVCQNSLFTGKLSPGSTGALFPTTAKTIKLLKAARRRVSEIALPKVLGGSGAATLHPSASMDFSYYEPHTHRAVSLRSLRSDSSLDEDEDPRSRFQAAVAHTTMKSAVANTLRRASLEKQSSLRGSDPPGTPPTVSRDNSSDSMPAKDAQEKEKQKNAEEEAFKNGYEQGMRASLGQDLSSLREQQNRINASLGDIMDNIDTHMEEPKSLKDILVQHYRDNVPKIQISSWRYRLTFGCFFIVMAILSVIISLLPVGSASAVDIKRYNPPL